MEDVAKRESPYLKPGRLADVLAGIQVMAVSEQYRQSLEDWTYYLSGLRMGTSDNSPQATKAAARWRSVFDDHPEFFRPSIVNPGDYALVLRRGLPRRYDLEQQKLLSERDLAQMVPERGRITRAPLAHAEMKALLEVALSLHKEATEREAAVRSGRLAWLPVFGSLTGVLLGIAGTLLAKLI